MAPSPKGQHGNTHKPPQIQEVRLQALSLLGLVDFTESHSHEGPVIPNAGCSGALETDQKLDTPWWAGWSRVGSPCCSDARELPAPGPLHSLVSFALIATEPPAPPASLFLSLSPPRHCIFLIVYQTVYLLLQHFTVSLGFHPLVGVVRI